MALGVHRRRLETLRVKCWDVCTGVSIAFDEPAFFCTLGAPEISQHVCNDSDLLSCQSQTASCSVWHSCFQVQRRLQQSSSAAAGHGYLQLCSHPHGRHKATAGLRRIHAGTSPYIYFLMFAADISLEYRKMCCSVDICMHVTSPCQALPRMQAHDSAQWSTQLCSSQIPCRAPSHICRHAAMLNNPHNHKKISDS